MPRAVDIKAYGSFSEALSGQQKITGTILEQDYAPPMKEAMRERGYYGEEEKDHNAFNTELAKYLKKLKKDLGASSIAQNYKGTGNQKARRQLYVRFKNGAVIDIWLDMGTVGLGGVVAIKPDGSRVYPAKRKITVGDMTPEQVYREVKTALKDWME